MSGALIPYNISLPAASGPWIYTPFRDGPAEAGWNASYTGNTTWPFWQTPDSNGAGSLYFRTQFETSKVELEFTGTGLVLCVTPNGAKYTLTVDGRIERTTGARGDPACADYGSTATMVSRGLEFGRHTAQVSVVTTGDRDFEFFGGVVTTNVAVGSASEKVTERTIDDAAPEWVMVPGRGSQQWDFSVSANTIEHTTSFMCFYRPNATASYTFRGASAIILYGGLYRDTHDYAVILDGKTVNMDASVSGWGVGTQPIFFESNLDTATPHTITVRNYNEDNLKCDGPRIQDFRSCCVSLDALVLIGSEASLDAGLTSSTSSVPTATIQSQPTSSGTSPVQQQSQGSQQQQQQHKSSSTSAGAIAGGVLGGILGGLIIAVAAFCLIRRHRRIQEAAYAQPTRHVDLHEGHIAAHAVRPYHLPPGSSYSSASGGQSHAPASDPKGGAFVNGGSPPTSYVGGSASPSNARPAHPSSGKGYPAAFPAPASHMSSNSAGSGAGSGRAAPLQQEDMDRVLQYVAEQMSQRGRQSGSVAADILPTYHR